MISLPWPPSVNRYWRSVRGKVLISAEGRKYRDRVKQEVMAQRVPTFHRKRLQVTIFANPPDRRRRDLDNLLKSLLDSLEHAGVYEDDGQIDDLRIVRGDVDFPGTVDVQVGPA